MKWKLVEIYRMVVPRTRAYIKSVNNDWKRWKDSAGGWGMWAEESHQTDSLTLNFLQLPRHESIFTPHLNPEPSSSFRTTVRPFVSSGSVIHSARKGTRSIRGALRRLPIPCESASQPSTDDGLGIRWKSVAKYLGTREFLNNGAT